MISDKGFGKKERKKENFLLPPGFQILTHYYIHQAHKVK